MPREQSQAEHSAADARLPVIHMQHFGSGDRAARQGVANAIGAACERMGFLYVTGHGVPDAVIESAQAATRDFFAGPTSIKRAVSRQPGTYRGYVPVMPFSEDRDSGETYPYEAFLMGPELERDEVPGVGLRWSNRWPDESDAMRRPLTAYYRSVDGLSDRLLQAFALALGQPRDGLLRCFRRPMTNISLLHYPARCGGGTGNRNARPHYDTNALTILLPGDEGGLQVEHRELGWMEVPPRPGCFVVNIGNMMEAWSGGRFRSTLHRVHPPAGRDRFSIAFFASPDYDTLVGPLPGVEPAPGYGARESLHAGRAFEAFVAGFDEPRPPPRV